MWLRVSTFVVLLLQLWVAVLLHATCSLGVAPKLESYTVDKGKVSVSGLSSGAFFAVQFHVAFSESIMGMGAVAGGPFWCARDNLETALISCMTNPLLLEVSVLVNKTDSMAESGSIDSPSNIKNHNIYVFSGTVDTVVVSGVVRKLEEYYSHFTSNIKSEYSIPSEHAMVTNDYGNTCWHLGEPYINNCNYSTAYNILSQIYGPSTKMASSTSMKEENLLEFDQTEFLGPIHGSTDTTGYIYVPSNCKDKSKECRLHIALHGCEQGREYVSNKFALHAGYNGVAEENNIIVLYPQVKSSTLMPSNPNGCWDWWGYTSSAYASKQGVQMKQVKAMMDRVASN